MKQLWKKGMVILGAFMLMLATPSVYAHAADMTKIKIEGYELGENKLRVYLNTGEEVELQEEEEKKEDVNKEIQSEDLMIFLGDKQYPVEKIRTFQELEEGVSYLFLVDVSGSVTKKDIENTKEILTFLTEEMQEKDNMALMEIKNEIGHSEFSGNREEILNTIQGLERTGEDTNLYLAVKKGIELLKEDSSCHQKKCILIISDGIDEQKNGILFEDVREAIQEELISICTIALPTNENEKEANAPDKILKSMTEQSAGGLHIRYGETQFSNQEIAKAVAEFVHRGIVAEISLEGYEPNGSKVLLSVGLDKEGKRIEGDSCLIPSYMISSVMTVPEAAEVVKEEGIAERVIEEQEESIMHPLYLWGGVIGSFIAILFFGIFLRSKKKQRNDRGMLHTTQPEEKRGDRKDKESYIFQLTGIGPMSGKEFVAETTEEVFIGRDKAADISTNGTCLNGIPVYGKQSISKGDVLYIGTVRYRIWWEKVQKNTNIVSYDRFVEEKITNYLEQAEADDVETINKVKNDKRGKK